MNVLTAWMPQKITARLNAFVLCMVAALLLVVGVSYQRLRMIEAANHQLQSEAMVKVATILETKATFFNLLRRISRVPYTTSAEEKARMHQVSEEGSKEFSALLIKAGAFIESEQDKQKFAELQGHVESFYKYQSRLLPLMDEGDYKLAAELLLDKTFRGHINKIDSGIQLLVKDWNEDAATLAAQTTDSITRALELMVLICAAVLTVMLVLSQLLKRQILRSVRSLQVAIQDIESSGDLSLRVSVLAEDEIGVAAHAFNRLMGAMQQSVTQVNRVVQALAAGDFTQRVDAQLRGDLGTMKEAVNVAVDDIKSTMAAFNAVMQSLYDGEFSTNLNVNVQGDFKRALDHAQQSMLSLSAVLGEVGQVTQAMAQGDLRAQATGAARGDLQALQQHLNASIQSLSSAIRSVNSNAQQVAIAANQTSQAIGQIADGSQHQKVAVSHLATAIRQSSESVADVTRNSTEASNNARASMTAMQGCMEKMGHMVDVVHAIAGNSEQISKITSVIEDIANKTNLLALNAAIEAARAGEHGKGFSVVAEEVGKLATSSAESSQQIAQLVEKANLETHKAVDMVQDVNTNIGELARIASQTQHMLERVAAALEQQNASLEEIQAGAASLDQIASVNAAASEEISASVIELSHIAESTRKEMQAFQC